MAHRRTETTTACFGVVTKKIRSLFRHFPKSKSWSEGFQLLPTPSHELLIVRDYKLSRHWECQSLIHLEQSDITDPVSPEKTFVLHLQKVQDEPKEEKKPSIQELRQRIETFNMMVQNGLIMKMREDGTYNGFIKVNLKLQRPVTVTDKPESSSVITMKAISSSSPVEKKTSFYMPLDAVKQLHISSLTTASEVIRGLLQKFQVVDDPLKFALFKQMQKDGQVLFQKLALTEHPLYLRLLAGPETEKLSFVLKENETGEVQWEAFTVPELQNFLLILEKEEKEKVQQVQKKYTAFRQHLQEALTKATIKPL
ncbi:ras association domain-containing protein 5 isoform X1 [Bufo gargarizans]|uniref:ras association domain-containing protein 5 isoform X1 n=1 Tax=Bufo gargarizans TaxID=30331 RepID=UPI001CF5C7A3|nr:ras association domain-containing protein 5 isoform X1 [Bufo gargarizans]